MKLLTPKQRNFLTQLALRAWKKLHGSGAIEETFDDYRHRIAKRHSGETISTAPASAFDDLFIAFKTEIGDTDEAFHRANERRTNAQRQDIHNIQRQLERGGLTLGYAIAIARDEWSEKLKLSFDALESLPQHATRKLLYTITARVNARLKKANQAPSA